MRCGGAWGLRWEAQECPVWRASVKGSENSRVLQRLLTRPGSWWIRAQYQRFRPLGRGLSPDEQSAMAGYFEQDLLSDVRIHQLDALSLRLPLHLARMAAITLADTIVLAHGLRMTGPQWHRLVFHELVHVVQFRVLGVDQFATQYLGGWLGTGFRYSRIPLEEQVRELETRFIANPGGRFPVLTEVRKQLQRASS